MRWGTTSNLLLLLLLYCHARVWCVLQLLEQAGFVNVRAEDRSKQFLQVLHREIRTTEAIRDEFIKVKISNKI